MKSCPTCNRTFEDTFTFCLIDGAILSAPFDPLATRANPVPRDTGGARTEVLPTPSHPGVESIAPTVLSPHPTSQETVGAASTPAQSPLNSAGTYANPAWDPTVNHPPAQPARRRVNPAVQLILGLLALVIVGTLFSSIFIPRGTAGPPLRALSGIGGVILAVAIRRGWLSAMISILIGFLAGALMLGMIGRLYSGVTSGNMITIAFFVVYGLVGWGITRLIGLGLGAISSGK